MNNEKKWLGKEGDYKSGLSEKLHILCAQKRNIKLMMRRVYGVIFTTFLASYDLSRQF
jgi:hypothetical protein